MDTDDLSQEAYKATIAEADKFNRDLTLEFGLLSTQCKNEDEYLIAAKEIIEKWKEDLECAFLDIFYDDVLPSQSSFEEAITKIESNISEVEKIPFKDRKFDFYG